jgi:serine/threonine protein kinase
MWSLGVCLLEIHTGKDLMEHLGLGKEEEEEDLISVANFFSSSEASGRASEQIKAVLDRELEGHENRHIRSLLAKLLSSNVVETEELEQMVEEEVDRLIADRDVSRDLVEAVLDMLDADLSNDDDLLSLVQDALSRLVGPGDSSRSLKAQLGRLLQKIVRLKSTRRISMAQVMSHAYVTNKQGTATLRGRETKREVETCLERMAAVMDAVQDQMQEIHDRVSEQRN